MKEVALKLDRHRKPEYYQKRLSALRTERASFITHWKECAEFVSPRRGRFFIEDRNKGDKRWNSIINSRATQAHKIARAGLFAGTMSPARPWFKLETIDKGMMEYKPVKDWLEMSQRILYDIFQASNFYQVAPQLLGELILFGSSLMTHVDDFDNVARFYPHTVGSFYFIQNERQEIDGFVREYQMTTEQLISKFGLENVSSHVKEQYHQGNYDGWHSVVHFVDRNPDYDPNRKGKRFKKYRSVKYEPAQLQQDKNKFLSEGGFDTFPAYAPRWDVTGEDIYGTDCPVMTVLGDVKQLQVQERRKGQAIDKMVNPPLRGPMTIKGQPVSSMPGGLNIYDSTGEQGQLAPVYTVDPKLQELRADMDAVERRINEGLFVDLFKAITDMKGIQPRNQLEISERNAEKLIQLGPVLLRVHNEFLDKLIDRTFAQALAADILPPPPPELQGMVLRVNYVSTLAMAQRALAAQGVEQLTGYVMSMAEAFPEATIKFDAQQAIDEYAQIVGAPPRVTRSDDEVAALQKQRQEEQARQQQMAMASEAASTANQGADAVSKMVDAGKAASQ